MPTLLRFLIGLVTIVYLQAAVTVSALVAVTTGGGNAWSFAASGAGTALLALVPMTAGILVSYTRWSDDDSKRRLRRWVGVGVALQLLGAVLVLLTGPRGAAVIIAVVEVIVSAGLDVAFAGMGRVARRRDRLPSTGDDWVDTTAADIRKGWRNAAAGFVIGLTVAALLVALSSAFLNPRHRAIDPQVTLVALSFAFIGAALGLIVTSFRIARRMREATGTDYATMRRIGRVVLRGKPERLTPDEQQRATRYARIAGRWLPYQGAQFGLLYTGIVLTQVSELFGRSDSFSTVQVAEIILLVVLYAFLLPLLLRRARRASTFAAAHTMP